MKKFIEVPKGLTFDQVKENIRQQVEEIVTLFFAQNAEVENCNLLVTIDSVAKDNEHTEFVKLSLSVDALPPRERILKKLQNSCLAARQKYGGNIFIEIEIF